MNTPGRAVAVASLAAAAAVCVAQGPARPAGEERVVAGMRLRWCPPGQFRMGSPPAEPSRRADEAQVDVVLSKGFWMGRHEVTQAQWTRIAGALPRTMDKGAGDDVPVYWVSYLDAQRFCERLTELARATGELEAGWEFLLPTEAQWEYACRAGTSTATAFGDRVSRLQANIDGAGSVAVGRYPGNAWGIQDMYGNVFEWCRDWYYARLPGGVDPDLSAKQGERNRDGTYSRVRRGGAWTDSAEWCRSAVRLRYEPERTSDHIGFRVVLAAR